MISLDTVRAISIARRRKRTMAQIEADFPGLTRDQIADVVWCCIGRQPAEAHAMATELMNAKASGIACVNGRPGWKVLPATHGVRP